MSVQIKGVGTIGGIDQGLNTVGVITATSFVGSGANLTSLPAANLTGTLPALAAPNLTSLPAANLTGTLPAISGANLTSLPAATQVTLAAQSSDTDCYPVFSLTATGNQALYTKSNRLSFNSVTGALSATSFSGSGANLTSIPITGGADNRVITASGANTIQGESGLTYNGQKLQVDTVTSETNAFRLYNTTTSATTYKINGEGDSFTGNVYPRSDGNLDLGFHSGYKWRDVVLSGGIRFGSATSTDYLDDYEEGSFTATLSASGGGASFASGHIQTACLYVKVGALVHVQGYFSGTNVTGAGSGIVKVSGLPFVSNNTTYYTICITHNTMTSNTCAGAYIQYSNTYFFPIVTNGTTGSTFNVGNPRYMMFGGSYPVQM